MVNKTKTFCWTICLTVILTGCTLGPDYQRPELNLPKEYQQAQSVAKKRKELNTLWWQGFNDKLINELVTKAVANNKTVKQALSRVNQSRAAAREALADLLPGLALSGGYEKAELSGVQFGGNGIAYELYNVSADTSWELDLFGKVRRNLESENALYQARTADLKDSIAILVTDLVRTYFQLRTAQEQVAIAKKNLELQEQTIKIINARLKAGTTSELDSSRAEAQFARTQATIPPLTAQVKTAMHRLAILTGQNPASLYDDLQPIVEVPEFTGELTVDAVENLLERRPDILAAENELKSYNALIGVRTNELFPSISLTGRIGYENTSWSNLLDRQVKIFSYGPRISWTPFSFGKIRARIKATEERALEALANYEQTVLISLEEVNNAFVSYMSQLNRAQSLEHAYTSSEKAYNIAKVQYDTGSLDLLSVLDVQANMLSDANELALNKQALNIAIVDIYKALGSGWENWDLVKTKN